MKLCISIFLFLSCLPVFAQNSELERRDFYGGDISLLIPKDFDSVPQAESEQYFSGPAPRVMFKNATGVVNIMIAPTQSPIGESSLEAVKDATASQMKGNKAAKTKIVKSQMTVINGKTFGYIKYVMTVNKTKVNGSSLLFVKDGNLWIFSLNYADMIKKTWKDYENMIVNSIMVK